MGFEDEAAALAARALLSKKLAMPATCRRDLDAIQAVLNVKGKARQRVVRAAKPLCPLLGIDVYLNRAILTESGLSTHQTAYRIDKDHEGCGLFD